MNAQNNFRRIIIEIICLLYVLLFVYAAVSKLLDFERFQVQLAQSPLLSAFALWVSPLVIGIELLIAFLLVFPRTRIVALFGALSLMTMFTAYIFIILHYSSFVPCSCGGILEKMTWNAHLAFNIVFLFLALVAIVFALGGHRRKAVLWHRKKYPFLIVFSVLISTLLVIVLFVSSEDIIHNKNPFIRRYPQNTLEAVKTVDLGFNSYYFAGFFNKRIYLANYTDPLHLLSFDSLAQKRKVKLSFDDRGTPFRSIKIKIRGNYFYLMDGNVPCIFRGEIKDQKITTQLRGVPRFTAAEPIDSTTIVFRSINQKRKANVLGLYHGGVRPRVAYAPHLLKQQIDGVFDTDGMLLYNEEFKHIVYTYFYRNQFIVAENTGKFQFNGNTIDTITHARIKVAYLKDKTERQMGAPPLLVNAVSETRNHLLFVNSKVPGRFENEKVWKQSFIIDVYNLNKGKYLLSFPIYAEGNQKIQSLFVSTTHLYVIMGTRMFIYRLNGLLKKEMKNTQGNTPDV